MNAALIRLREEVRILNDNIRHVIHGGEAQLSPIARNDLIAQMRSEHREIVAAIRVLQDHARGTKALLAPDPLQEASRKETARDVERLEGDFVCS